MKIAADVLKRAKKVKLLAMDVDGVLTAGEIIILNSGEEMKIWSVKDRMGFALLKASETGLKLAWITARESEQVRRRAEDLGIHFLFQRSPDKWKQLEECAAGLGLKADEVAYIGDDLVDLKCLKNVGLAVCPPESHELLLETCHHVTQASAGKGVAREVIEILLQAQGRWKQAIARFVTFLVMSAALAFSVAACSSQVPLQEAAEKPDQWIEQFTITETNGGVPVWILNSGSAQVYNAKQKATLDQIALQFMNTRTNAPVPKKRDSKHIERAKKSQTLTARLTAPNGEVNLETKDLVAWGGVEVQSEDGTKLLTERLVFSSAQRKIFTESPIKIVKKDSILLGEGLEATPDLEVVKIFRHQASIYPKEIGLTE